MSSQPLSLLFILLGQGPQLQTWGPLELVEPLEPAGCTGGARAEGGELQEHRGSRAVVPGVSGCCGWMMLPWRSR